MTYNEEQQYNLYPHAQIYIIIDKMYRRQLSLYLLIIILDNLIYKEDEPCEHF